MYKFKKSVLLKFLFFIPFIILSCCCEKPVEPDTSSIGSITWTHSGTVLLGDTVNVTWSGDAKKVSAEFSTDSTTFTSMTVISSSEGTAKIVIPKIDVSATNYIRLKNTGNTDDTPVVTDVFVTKTLIITNPLGGETFSRGENITITWKAASGFVNGIIIKVTYDNGRNWALLNTGGQIDINGSYLWVIASDATLTTEAQIELTDYLDSAIKEKSGKFTVQ